MASIISPVDKSFKARIKVFPWVNWSEAAREELMKRDIFERYKQTGAVTDEDWKFCEQLDWHPVDELPLKVEFVKDLKKARSEPSIKLKSVSDIFR